MTHPVVARLQSADPSERRAACLEAASDPSAVLLIDALVGALGDTEASVGRAASDALTRIGRDCDEVDTLLRRALHGDDSRGRWGAAYTRARLGPPDTGMLPAVVEALSSADGDIRWAAAKLLVDMGRLHGEVLRVVLALAADGATPVARRMALFCLRELAPDDPHAARALLAATHDDDADLRRAAFTALAALLDPPEETLDRLAQTLAGDADPVVPRLAAVALGEIASRHPGAVRERITNLLAKAAQTDDPELRRAIDRAKTRAEGTPTRRRAPSEPDRVQSEPDLERSEPA